MRLVGRDAQAEYWRGRLADLPVVEVPSDRPRAPVQSFLRATESMRLDADLYSEIERLGVRGSIDTFVVLASALSILMVRYTGQEDIVIGSVSSDSTRDTSNEGQGFANLVALRTDLHGDPDVRECIARVAKTIEEASAHRDYPFEELAKALDADGLTKAPIFQVLLVLRGSGPGVSDAPASVEHLAALGEHTARCDLVIVASPGRENIDTLDLECDYDAELFEPATIQGFLTHLCNVLIGIVEELKTSGQQPISVVPLIDADERRRLLTAWNDTARAYPEEVMLHTAFESQVARSPDAVALRFDGAQLTYRELDRKANQLAHYLRAHGVGPDACVGLFMERSFEMVIGIYGILKAGGAYVPLDPEYTPQTASPSWPKTPTLWSC